MWKVAPSFEIILDAMEFSKSMRGTRYYAPRTRVGIKKSC